MKAKLLHYLSATAYGASFIAGLNLIGVATFLPAHIAKPVMLVPPLFGVLGHSALAVGDYLDDGVKNDSFKCAPLACLAALCLAVLGLTSCGVVETKPDGTKIEKKPDNTTIGLVVGVGLKVLELLHSEPAAPVVLPTK